MFHSNAGNVGQRLPNAVLLYNELQARCVGVTCHGLWLWSWSHLWSECSLGLTEPSAWCTASRLGPLPPTGLPVVVRGLWGCALRTRPCRRAVEHSAECKSSGAVHHGRWRPASPPRRKIRTNDIATQSGGWRPGLIRMTNDIATQSGVWRPSLTCMNDHNGRCAFLAMRIAVQRAAA